MTRTFQNSCLLSTAATTVTVRRAFLEHAAELYGLALTDAELDVGAALDDRAAVATAFPQLTDVELSEALWALGHFA